MALNKYDPFLPVRTEKRLQVFNHGLHGDFVFHSLAHRIDSSEDLFVKTFVCAGKGHCLVSSHDRNETTVNVKRIQFVLQGDLQSEHVLSVLCSLQERRVGRKKGYTL